MDKRRLRGFLKEHVFKGTLFKMEEVSNEKGLQVFKIGSIIAACSKDTEVSKKAVLDYAMSMREGSLTSFMLRNLTENEVRDMLEKRIFGIREGGAYFL